MADPDYIFDADEWECTYSYADRNLALEDLDLRVGDVKRFRTLVEGPDRFAARVVVTRDEAGDPDEIEWQWFDTEAEARAACGMPAFITEG
jgi:hypothetical protein